MKFNYITPKYYIKISIPRCAAFQVCRLAFASVCIIVKSELIADVLTGCLQSTGAC